MVEIIFLVIFVLIIVLWEVYTSLFKKPENTYELDETKKQLHDVKSQLASLHSANKEIRELVNRADVWMIEHPSITKADKVKFATLINAISHKL